MLPRPNQDIREKQEPLSPHVQESIVFYKWKRKEEERSLECCADDMESCIYNSATATAEATGQWDLVNFYSWATKIKEERLFAW